MSQRYADHRTALPRNHWYIAALSEEVGEALTERWLLSRNVLLFRKRDGQAVALRNRCPHRSYPLSRGTREGDTVVCGYHGIAFDAQGGCVRIPSQEGAVGTLRARSYPVIERSPFIWIWMGEGAPQPAEPPAIPWLSNPAYAHVTGVFDVGCSYIRLHENVLDLSHLAYLHKETLPGFDILDRPQVTEAGGGVRVLLTARGVRRAGSDQSQPEQTMDLRFVSPAVHIAENTARHPDSAAGSVRSTHSGYVHAFTPIDQRRTRYFWSISRDEKLGDEALSATIKTNFATVLMQDIEGLSLVEEIWAREADDFEEFSVVADRAGLRMRRIVQTLAEREAEA
jgi:phenylpropionate dioxygenase-like ring-hydroxylating dioxygenase large terminal subunit